MQELKTFKATLYDTTTKKALYSVKEEHGAGWLYWMQLIADNKLLGVKSRITHNKRGERVYIEQLYVDVVKIIKL